MIGVNCFLIAVVLWLGTSVTEGSNCDCNCGKYSVCDNFNNMRGEVDLNIAELRKWNQYFPNVSTYYTTWASQVTWIEHFEKQLNATADSYRQMEESVQKNNEQLQSVQSELLDRMNNMALSLEALRKDVDDGKVTMQNDIAQLKKELSRIQTLCSPPCENGGQCVKNVCNCPPSFTGNRCQQVMCSPPCENGGQCMTNNTCECTISFAGARCQQAVCSPPCENGGECMKNNICSCSSIFTGDRCQEGPLFDINFTLQNVWGRLQTDSRSIIQCLSDDSYKKIKFSRKLDTGQGARLPKFSQQFLQGKPVFARILLMPGEDKMNRFGAFQCMKNIQGVPTEIVTLKSPPSNLVELDAISPYKIASVNDSVELEVNVTQKLELPIKWRHNGVYVPDWDNLLKIEIPNVQKEDSGIYECYYEGRRNEGVHALMRLIVRGCDNDKYGNDCDEDCPPCYNGGVCHETFGVCVCPAGFTGENCEIACGGNRFGADCSKFCSPPQKNNSTDELCSSHLFCKPDPYGCSCAPGFKGSSCMEHCEPGWYGADCKQPCHCAYGISSCNRITGACQGGCAGRWRGNSCQIEECTPGRFGTNCASTCHCQENSTAPCNKITGVCEGDCEAGYMGNDCQSQPVTCPMFEAFPLLEISYSKGLSIGSKASFSCSPPKILNGNSDATCMANGVWSHSLPKCIEPVSCQMFEPRLSLEISYSNGFSIGSKASFTCSPPSVLDGVSEATCMANGLWSHSLPQCI